MTLKKNSNRFSNIIFQNIIVALAYFIFGKLGFFLSDGSGLASLVWPAAAVALASVLFFGYRIWFGIYFGALLLTIPNLIETASTPISLFAGPHIFFLAAGATLQALVAGWALNRLDLLNHDFSNPKKIGLFYFIAGPLCSLISCSIATLSFITFGMTSFNSTFNEWLLWWGADSTSIIIFITFILIWTSFEEKRRNIVSLVLASGLVITFGIFFIGREWEEERLTLLFNQEVIASRDMLDQIENSHNSLLKNLAGVKDYRPNLSREDFTIFAENNLSFNKSVMSFSWIEIVADENRTSFEDELSKIHGHEVLFRGFTSPNIPNHSERHDSYSVIKFIEPYETFKFALGFNINSDKTRETTLKYAKETNEPVITTPIILAAGPNDNATATVYQTYYNDGNLVGYFALLINLSDLINEIIPDLNAKELEVSMRDKYAEGSPIFTSERIIDGYIDRNPIIVEVEFFNRTWELLFRRTLNFIDKNKTSQPLFIAMSGMIFAALIAIGIMILSGQRQFLENLVRKRTLDLEKANNTKSQFMANMSHDLRTPLNAIIGFSDIMQKELFGKLGSEKYMEYTQDINHSSEYLLSLINDVLDFSEIEANSREIDKEEIDIELLLNECIRILSPLSDKKNINPELIIEEGCSTVNVDRRAIKQVIINLLSNAIKFTDNNGHISIIVKQTQNNHIIEIVDTGEGISERNISTILEPFTRVENHPHQPQEGSGLGLSIVNALIKLHGGSVDIKSTVDVGTTVTVKIPKIQTITNN